MTSLNPLKWWHLHLHRQQWQDINIQFTNSYRQHNYQSIANHAKSMVDIALKSGDKQLLFNSYQCLFLCYEEIKFLDLASDSKKLLIELRKNVKAEIKKYPIQRSWWL